MEDTSDIRNNIQVNMNGIRKLINIIDRVRTKQSKHGNDDAIAYLCRHRIYTRKDKKGVVYLALKKVRKHPDHLGYRQALENMSLYQKIRSSWNDQKLQQLIDKKFDLLTIKRLGNHLNDEKIEQIEITRPDLMKVISDFSYLFTQRKKTQEIVVEV